MQTFTLAKLMSVAVWLLGAAEMLQQDARVWGSATERDRDQGWGNHLLLLLTVNRKQ